MANKQAAAPKESAVRTMVVPVVVLVVICIVCSAILAALNSVTAPIIEENARLQALESYVSVLPDGTDAASLTEFENLTTSGVTGAVSTPDGARCRSSDALHDPESIIFRMASLTTRRASASPFGRPR